MQQKRKSFSAEYKDEAAKMVIEQSKPVASVAREIGVNEQTLRNWVNAYRRAMLMRSLLCRCRSGHGYVSLNGKFGSCG